MGIFEWWRRQYPVDKGMFEDEISGLESEIRRLDRRHKQLEERIHSFEQEKVALKERAQALEGAINAPKPPES